MGKLLGFLTGFVGLLFVIVLISAFFVKISWAYSISTIFGLKELTWVEAFSLSVLANSLLGGSRIKDKSSD